MNSSPLRRQVRDRPVLRSLHWMVTVSSSRPTMRALVSDTKDVAGEVLEHGSGSPCRPRR